MSALSQNMLEPSFRQQEEDTFSVQTQIIFIALSIVSSFISLLFPIVYFLRRKCREHPSSLIAIISLLEALSNYNVVLIAVNIYKFEEIVKINKVFDFLVFYKIAEPTQAQFCEFNFTIYILLQLMSIAYNISFSADLLVTLKNPFFSGSRRMKFYNIFSLFFVSLSIPLSVIQAEDICKQEFFKRSTYKMPIAFLVSLGVFYLVSIVIIIMSFKTVQTNQIRRKYIRFHRIILLTLLILWACPIATNIFIILGDQKSAIFHIINLLSFVCLLVSGAFVNIVRFYNDPYVWGQVKKTITECRPKKKIRKADQQNQNDNNKELQDLDAWNLPLAHAVQTFNHQSVISHILQIVLQTCTNTQEELAIHQSQFNQFHSQQRYQAQSAILSLKQIKNMLRTGTKQDVKRLTKIIKTEQMLCIESKEKQKNIYKLTEFAPPGDLQADQSLYNLEVQQKISNFIKQNKAIAIKVKSYGDPVFLALRLLDNITSQQLHKTLSLSLNAQNIKKARQSLGASGSFFFFSYDNRLVIKTINRGQSKVFLSFLPDYYEHILNNPNSLISRAYGLFSVQIAGISKIYFIMMENTMRTFQQNHVKYVKFDLKGSTIKRQVRNPNADVFKDINFLKSDDAFLIMSQQRKKKLFQQIKSDITLLSSQNIMDYSLLLGIGNYKKIKRQNNQILQQQDLIAQENEWRCFDDGHSLTGKIYSLSLIDYLQKFDINKYMELKLKKVFKGGGDISSVDTSTYFDRFLKFVNRIIVVYRT